MSAMGLLDDAIREHLECKRQHGADPDEVARQEHEALGPIDRGYNAPSAADTDAVEGFPQQGKEAAPASAPSSARPAVGPDSTYAGEETAELDMRTVLKTESASSAASATAGDSLEWEVPGDSRQDSSTRQDSTTRRDSTARQGTSDPPETAGADEEPAEDVLEETPDFLRDTPDHERLWFEQQPPRDFDFDK